MSDYPKGLRFDIYERITLPEEVVGIGELEDIELLPRITMQTHEDQAVLSGDLMLVGTYVGVEPDSGVRQLRHRIPVEITLPLRRIRRMDSVGIEIDNFDVELLSARTLNITGVISLTGVDTTSEQTSQQQAWREQGEAWFVHEAARLAGQQGQEVGLSAETPAAARQDEEESPAQGATREEAQTPAMHARPEPTSASQDASGQAASTYAFGSTGGDSSYAEDRVEPQPAAQEMPKQAPPAEKPVPQKQAEIIEVVVKEEAGKAIAAAAEEQVGQTGGAKDNQAAGGAPKPANVGAAENVPNANVANVGAAENVPQQANAGAADNAANIQAPAATSNAVKPIAAEASDNAAKTLDAQAANEQPEAAPVKSEPQEMKIAFGSNKQDTSGWAGAVAGVKSLLQQAAEKLVPQAEEDKAEPEAAEKKQAKRGEEQLQWKNLLLSSEHEEQRFRKMRMCIVQKEETLDTIASRYSLHPKELLLYNRLESDRVYEGQIIYIPK